MREQRPGVHPENPAALGVVRRKSYDDRPPGGGILITQHLTSLPERPVFQPFPPELAERFLTAAVPMAGQAPEDILAEFARDVEPYPFGNGHPRFFNGRVI